MLESYNWEESMVNERKQDDENSDVATFWVSSKALSKMLVLHLGFVF